MDYYIKDGQLYHAVDYENSLTHKNFKYIKRERMANGKYRYYYDLSELRSNLTSAGRKERARKADQAYTNAIDDASRAHKDKVNTQRFDTSTTNRKLAADESRQANIRVQDTREAANDAYRKINPVKNAINNAARAVDVTAGKIKNSLEKNKSADNKADDDQLVLANGRVTVSFDDALEKPEVKKAVDSGKDYANNLPSKLLESAMDFVEKNIDKFEESFGINAKSDLDTKNEEYFKIREAAENAAYDVDNDILSTINYSGQTEAERIADEAYDRYVAAKAERDAALERYRLTPLGRIDEHFGGIDDPHKNSNSFSEEVIEDRRRNRQERYARHNKK